MNVALPPGAKRPRRIELGVLGCVLGLVVSGGVGVARGQEGSAKPQAAGEGQVAAPAPIEFEEETLENGLRVIYAPLRQAPVVHVRVLYHVGSRDERPDRQGFAHMFEHMMFRGSAHVKPEEHMKLIGVVGGNSNAFTSFDQTVYVNTIPSNHLELALYLEADRMASFKVDENIYKTERKVVAEEWRIRQNRPYGTQYEDFLKNQFTAHSYRWTPIGNMDHLKAAEVAELQEFFNTYYLPNNAILVIAGDIDVAKTKPLVKRYYGWIPKGPEPKRAIPAEPEQTEAKRVTVDYRVPLPAVMTGWQLPPYKSDDHYALGMLGTILSGGRSARLDRRLVFGSDPQAVQVGVTHMPLEDAGLFAVSATVMQGKDPKKVEQAVSAAVQEVAENGVTVEELEKARTQYRVDLIRNRMVAMDLADQLGDEALFGGDPARVNEELAKVEAVTPEQVQAVAKKYLTPQRATTMVINPDPLGKAAQVAKAEEAANAPVKPSSEPVKPREVTFPADWPQRPRITGGATAAQFEKGTETQVNGVRVIVMHDSRLPLVNWSLTMRRGSHSDPKGKEGLASITGDMVRRGAGGMTFAELNEDLESRGISLEVSDGGDYTRIGGSTTTEQLEHGLTRTREMLMSPTFPADEFEKLKQQTIESLVLSLDNPSNVAGQDMLVELYGDTPLGRNPTPASVKGITLEDVKKFYQTYYRPNDAILVFSGDVTPERGQELAKVLTDRWEAGEMPSVEYADVQTPAKRRIILVDRPGGKQSVVRMAVPAYTIESDDKFPGSVAGQILTSGIDSRLGRYVRAEKGLAYGVHGVFQPGRYGGAFVAGTDTAVESTADAVEAIFKVLNDMRTAAVTPEELAEAQQRVAGGTVMNMQTIGQQAGYRVDGLLNGYPIDYYDTYPQRIAQVTTEQVQEVMKKYVDDGQMVIVVVGPAETVKAQLERLGEVKVVPMPALREGGGEQQEPQLLKKAA
jgi:zinc protease